MPYAPNTAIDSLIKQIAFDNKSGALEILRRAGEVYSSFKSSSPASVEQAKPSLFEVSVRLARAQPDMSPLLRLASAAVSAADAATTAEEVANRAEEAALGFIERAAENAHQAAMNAATLINNGSRALTHSRSSTIVEAFIEARRRGTDFSVTATESRPMLEGRELAVELARAGIPVTLIADAAAWSAMDGINIVLLGADAITQEVLVNKIGTHIIALAARERGLASYSVCDTSKFINHDCHVTAHLNNAADELWADAPAGVGIANSYFEPTPLACFTKIITERGSLSAREAARIAEEATVEESLLKALR